MSGDAHSPEAALRRLIVGYRLSQALYVAAKLGVADLLSDGPKNVGDLAQASGAHAPSLRRVLRLLAGEGVFAEVGEGRFGMTPLAEPLRGGIDGSLRPRAAFDGEAWNWHAWGNLLHSVMTGESAFDHTHGTPFFECLSQHPGAAAGFDELMAAQTSPWARGVVDAYDFSGIGTLVDVGGGYGALLAAILKAHPEMKGVLFDLPHVVESAGPKLAEAGVADRCATVGGDFIEEVPEGGDAYVLKHILHDWDDGRCKVILANCRLVMPADGRLLVVEVLIPPGNEPDYGKFLDVHMLVLTKGRERTRDEYAALLGSSGFALSRVVPTRSELSIIEAVAV